MGYTTRFSGEISFNRALTEVEKVNFLSLTDDDKRGEDRPNRPNSYCQWVLNETNDGIEWDGGEKFYDYVEWLQFISEWLKNIGVILNGKMKWSGEDVDDIGTIFVNNNIVTTNEDPSRLEHLENLLSALQGSDSIKKQIIELFEES